MSEFSDRPFVAGSVVGLRAFRVDTLGRLTGVTHKDVWTPGENEAVCHAKPDMEELAQYYAALAPSPGRRGFSAGGFLGNPNYFITSIAPSRDKPKTQSEYEAQKKAHALAGVKCQCGFYAYFDGGNDYLTNASYASGGMFAIYMRDEDKAPRIGAIVEGWGTCTVGTRGFRAEKARVLALVIPESTAARHEVAFQKVQRNYPGLAAFATEKEAVRAFPLTDPDPASPTTDEDFWTRSAS